MSVLVPHPSAINTHTLGRAHWKFSKQEPWASSPETHSVCTQGRPEVLRRQDTLPTPRSPLSIIDEIWWLNTYVSDPLSAEMTPRYGLLCLADSAVELRPSCPVITGSIAHHCGLPSLPCINSHPSLVLCVLAPQINNLRGDPADVSHVQPHDWPALGMLGITLKWALASLAFKILRIKAISIVIFTELPSQKLKEKTIWS